MQLSALLSAAFLATQASAHGFMGWPITRILPGDQQNGYSFARAAANRNTAVHPDADINCQYLPKGPVFTQTMAPGVAVVDYTITAFHMGGCNVTISRDNQQTWQKIGEDPTCGVQNLNPSGRGTININIPDGTYSAVIRWTYEAANGGNPNEIFNNCADVNVAPSGSNQHLQVEMLAGSSPWTVQLPKTPWQFQRPGSSFINQCVSLAAGGGFAGGSSYYQYQCPYGSTCQTVNGVDACVGGNIPTSTTTTTTKAATSTTTTTTVATTTATTTTTTTKIVTTAPTVTAPTKVRL
ncbi:UNVERIFIED_CONTAM: hypothetical protein HDU68_001784 [Siphonaria sp. JEL0065]|nr:hypothetical protein HDU68_001784 [Siphonaria sp. JEL0065]